jgi:hypothetical protein
VLTSLKNQERSMLSGLKNQERAMERAEPWWRRRWKKEGAGLPAPAAGSKRYFYLLKTHPWKLIRLNLLFCLLFLPLVTAPAALCGINRVFIKLIREGHCFLWTDFAAEFKSSFLKSLPFGLLFGGGLFTGWYLLSLGLTNGETVFGLLFSALGIFVVLLTLLLGGWTFVLIAMLPLKNRDIFRNVRALATLEKGRSVAILGLAIAPPILSILLFPISLPALLFFFIALSQYTISFLVNDAAQTHIIQPWEASGEGRKPEREQERES